MILTSFTEIPPLVNRRCAVPKFPTITIKSLLLLDINFVRRCIELLQAIIKDRSLLIRLPEKDQIDLLIAAGRVSRPSRLEQLARRRVYRSEERKRIKTEDRQLLAETHIRSLRREAVFVAPAKPTVNVGPAQDEPTLNTPRNCYICKIKFDKLHFFYDAMCGPCADFNYSKRFQTASLKGKTAVITGARLKIGYQASLMMLRAGAKVIATTRFPQDAARRYSREQDFKDWSERLQVHGLDLRHSPSVEIFCRYLNSSLEGLDILVNNAAQTVRRPPAFYQHLLEWEQPGNPALASDERKLLRSHEHLKSLLTHAPAALPQEGPVDATGMAVWHRGGSGIGIKESAMLSQLKYNYDDADLGLDVFPAGRTDADLQQVDLRKMNSWRMALADVPTAEMIELQLINSVAPFILCSKLKPLMLRRKTWDKHIVNVSAMEGSFSRHTKTDKHPHTNMAKAALNMLTLTSAADYAQDGIYMNAVDTGWVTDEDPIHMSLLKQEIHGFEPPLDIVDGAARVCDPFFSGLLQGNHLYGKFFKDYAPTNW
ncbi:MAG: SDR family oxidoreductase [Elusimicrobia bacterium]|nr:SDR family oxidoreductase [Elusimicrobiota bacterium]